SRFEYRRLNALMAAFGRPHHTRRDCSHADNLFKAPPARRRVPAAREGRPTNAAAWKSGDKAESRWRLLERLRRPRWELPVEPAHSSCCASVPRSRVCVRRAEERASFSVRFSKEIG